MKSPDFFLTRAERADALARARALRLSPSRAEAVLWSALRDRQVRGLKFRRRHPLGIFIADFYCPALRLVLEVDGPHHAQQRGRDELRDSVLRNHGVEVVRLSADLVMEDMPRALRIVVEALEARALALRE